MAGNPSFKKRDKERQRQEKQRLKAAKKAQRKQDKANGIVPVDSDEMQTDGEQGDQTDETPSDDGTPPGQTPAVPT
jgi:hypothetical protein